MADLRQALPDEGDLVVDLLQRVYGGGGGGAFPRWVLSAAETGFVLVSDVSIGAGIAFGQIGWIGGIGVTPESRRRGLGAEVTSAVIDELRRRGCTTMLLLATELGRPTYERLGFVTECDYVVADRGPAEVPALPTVSPASLAAAAGLDAWATGSDRRAALAAATGGIVEDDGFVLQFPWTDRPVVASTPETGLRLLEQAHPLRALVPEANEPAVDWLGENGYDVTLRYPRMRLGPALEWRPEALFGGLSLLTA